MNNLLATLTRFVNGWCIGDVFGVGQLNIILLQKGNVTGGTH
jgi:hypothetical protein